MRIRKDHEIRKKELLLASYELFCNHGYQETMIIDIVTQAAVAKGTFYYYFATKEAVLCSIFEYYSTRLVDSFKWDDPTYSTVDKLNIFIRKILDPSPLDKLIIKLFEEDLFSLLSKAWQKQIDAIFNPVLLILLTEGMGNCSVKIMNGGTAAEILPFFWSTVHCLWELSLSDNPDLYKHSYLHTQEILQHLIGCPLSLSTASSSS